MTKISMVVIVDKANGLGKNNQLLCHLPADLAHFKAITWGKPILMGRKTYESIGKPLPGRRNIVISRQAHTLPGVEIFPSLEVAFAALRDYPEVMVVGGAQIYQQVLPMADYIYLTRIDYQFVADVFFPHLDDAIWRCTQTVSRPADEKNKYALSFFEFERQPCPIDPIS